jgi:thiol-disulfide isomerase/thioredoxin
MNKVLLLTFSLFFGYVNISYTQVNNSPKSVEEYIAQIDIKVGDTINGIMGYTLGGLKVDDNYFQGNVTVINFTRLSCIACLIEYRCLNSIYKMYKTKGVNVIAIYPTESNDIKEYLQNDKIFAQASTNPLKLSHSQFDAPRFDIMSECSVLKSKTNYCNPISNEYGFTGYPITLIVDENLVVRHMQVGFYKNDAEADFLKNEWMEVINALLNQ